MAGRNRLLRELVEIGGRVFDLLEDRLEPVDGTIWCLGTQWTVIPAAGTTWTAVRVAAGDYRLERTAAGAETHVLVLPLSDLVRRAEAAGLKITAVVVAYNITVAAATTVSLTVNRARYADRVAVAVDANFGGTGVFDATHDTNAERVSATAGNNPHLMTMTLPDPQYQDNDSAVASAELSVVLPNTSKFQLIGGGLRVAHNYL